MTRKERRGRGLCVNCEAPAAHNPTRSNAHARAISEGRGLTSDAPLRGLPFEQLTTYQRCEKCMEKRNKCKICKKRWKEAGLKSCRQCLEVKARRSADRYVRLIEEGLCGRCGRDPRREGRGSCQRCAKRQAEIDAKRLSVRGKP